MFIIWGWSSHSSVEVWSSAFSSVRFVWSSNSSVHTWSSSKSHKLLSWWPSKTHELFRWCRPSKAGKLLWRSCFSKAGKLLWRSCPSQPHELFCRRPSQTHKLLVGSRPSNSCVGWWFRWRWFSDSCVHACWGTSYPHECLLGTLNPLWRVLGRTTAKSCKHFPARSCVSGSKKLNCFGFRDKGKIRNCGFRDKGIISWVLVVFIGFSILILMYIWN